MPSLTGRRFPLVGGDSGARERIRDHLLRLDAQEVRVIAPHWESGTDERVFREQVLAPDSLAILLSDRVGHQEQNLLRKLNMPFVYAPGGPSRVARDVFTYLAAHP